MPRFAANLTMLFNEVDFLARFERARAAGFEGVEYLFPYAHPASEVAAALHDQGLTQALFNFPAGDWGAGERGLAARPEKQAEFEASIETALSYAEALNCSCLHVMSGLVREGEEREALFEHYVRNLTMAAEAAEPLGITLVVELLNNRDVPGYLIPTLEEARRAVEATGKANVGLQFDFYHVQIMQGDLAKRFEAHADLTRHIQIAGVPERFEPDVGEINYPYLFELVDRLGYQGWVGCEYKPKGRTEDGLGWLKALG